MSKLDPRDEAQGHVPNGGLAGHSVGEIYPFALSFHPHPYGETGLWRVLDTRNGEYQTVHETAESAYAAALRHKQEEADERASRQTFAEYIYEMDKRLVQQAAAAVAKENDEKASWETYKRYCRADWPAASEEAQGHVPNSVLAGHSVGEIYPFALEYRPAVAPSLEAGKWNVIDCATGECIACSFPTAGAAYDYAAACIRLRCEEAAKLLAQRSKVDAEAKVTTVMDLKITEEGPFTFFVSHASPPALSLRTRLGPFKSQQEAVIAAHSVLMRNLMHS